MDSVSLTPKEIVKELDAYIIGQQDAKKNVAIALRNRWRRMNAPVEMRNEIMPNNILMIGSTGVGKTEIARRLARIAQAPFVKVEASKFTEVGYVGRDVESMVRDLVENSIGIVQAEKKKEVEIKAAEMVEEIILDALIPPLDSDASDTELNYKTRQRFREKIRSGELDSRKIEVDVSQNSSSPSSLSGPGMDEGSMIQIQDMISGMMPKKKTKRKVSISEARKLLLEDEASKLIDMEYVKTEAIFRAENTGIIFIDEIDKIAAKSGKSGGEVSREGVQRDLLPIVEGSNVNTKYGVVNSTHVLFIGAGAFHVARPSDLIPELQGRFPIRVELSSLTKDDFYRILKDPKNALTKQYVALLASEGVKLTWEDEAIERVATLAFEVNEDVENIGARRLYTIISQLLNDVLFEVPNENGANEDIVITRKMVDERLSDMVKRKDVSEFIL